jgi:hypothetical protein
MTTDPQLLRGSFRILLLYDVAEAIDLAQVRKLLGPRCAPDTPTFTRRTPEYIRFAQAPVIEPRAPFVASTGEHLACWIKYYGFAVVAVEIEAPFACGWSDLLAKASHWMGASEVESAARAMVEEHLKRITPAITRPTDEWLQENYLVINVQTVEDGAATQPPAADLVASHGAEIVQSIRGEVSPLAEKSLDEALEASLSYYASDLVVVGSLGAFVYDRAEDAAATTQVLEYAKMQLLEFRCYDNLMSELLADIYTMLDQKRNIVFSRWTLPRDAQRVNAIRLDVMDLTERVDNAIKFFSDVYYARVYRLAAARIGVTDFRELVDEKLRTAGELYEFMVDQFDETRSFVLEVAVGILALIDVIFLFRR